MSAKRRLLVPILSGIMALLILGTMVFIFIQTRVDRVASALQLKEILALSFTVHDGKVPIFTHLVLGHPESRRLAFFDLPPELGSLINSLKRVDTLSVLFNPNSPEAFLAHQAELAGMPLPFYIHLDLDDVANQVDLVSGLDLFISNSYEQVVSEPWILLPSGTLVLDGPKVKDFISYAEEGEPSADRSARQQKFLQSLLRRWGEQKDFLLNPRVKNHFFQHLRSNLDERELESYLEFLRTANLEQVVFQRTLGVERVVDGKAMLFPHYNGNLMKQALRLLQESLAQSSTGNLSGVVITVEILNGTPTAGLAGRTGTLLRSLGFEVLSVGNAEDQTQESTQVIENRGNLANAQRLTGVLRGGRVVSTELPSATADITLILGKDFDGRFVRNSE